MTACDTHTEEVAELERLAAEMVRIGYHADIRAHADRLPYLAVTNPRARVLSEKVYVQGGSYWWSWAEVIARTEDVTQAAATLANVLRAVNEE
jgi:hypothetical protein